MVAPPPPEHLLLPTPPEHLLLPTPPELLLLREAARSSAAAAH
jgi:hypothetical protein